MVNEIALAKTRTRIKEELSHVACKLKRGIHSQLLVWVIPGMLACAHRPLRYHPTFGGSGIRLPPSAAQEVLKWVEQIASDGIRSIICLMSVKEIQHYAALDLSAPNILALYQQKGFVVCHLPWDDPEHRAPGSRACFLGELMRIRDEALACFDNLPKPTLIHCSAGQDRSAPVAAYIYESRPHEII